MKKRMTAGILCVAWGGFFLATSHAAFTLLDDFESYNTGPITPQSDNWTFDTADGTVAEASGNKYLIQGEDTNAHTVFNNGSTLLADNAMGTYFFRAQMPAGGSHNGTGVSAKEGFASGWSDGGAIIRLGGTNPSSGIWGYDESLGTSGTYAKLSTNTTTEVWYNFWVVLNNSGAESERTYDVYIQSDDDTTYTNQTQIGSGLQYRSDANTQIGSIESIYFRSANDGVSAYFDDLYFDGSGENLANPLGSGPGPDPTDPAEITNFVFNVSGDLLISFAPGGSGYMLTSTEDLLDPFTEETNAVYDSVDTYTVPAASVPANQSFYRVELAP